MATEPAINLAFNLPMHEALEYWRGKVQMSPKDFYALADIHKARAFTVSGLARADMLNDIYNSLNRALAEGTTFAAWKKSLAPVWEENGWTGHRAWRIDNIFRTNVQTAYNVGRYKQMMESAEGRPYWQYSAVNDSRTRPTHRALHGRVYRYDSPFWDSFYPPNGFRCRCKVVTLSARQVEKEGLEVRDWTGTGELIEPMGDNGPMPARPLMPDHGFEGNPGKEAWEPDLSKYPPALREKLEGMLAPSGGAAPVQPVPVQPEVPTFKGIEKANAWAVDNDLADHADFTGVKPEVAKAWLQSLSEHLHEFPELRKQQKFTGTCQAQFAQWREVKIQEAIARLRTANPHLPPEHDFRKLAERFVPPKKVTGDTFAHSWSQKDVSGVAVNKKWGAVPEEWKKALSETVASKFHPEGCSTIRSVADHEMGHQLDDLLGLHLDREVVAAYSEAKARGMREEVSTYAGKNINEFIAECWAESCNNPAPREFARRIAAIVRDRYAAQHPGILP